MGRPDVAAPFFLAIRMDADEARYYRRTLELLEDSYLAADERGDIAGGSGSGGGLARWERKRRLIADAFDHDGTWLDVGCANGLLMESIQRWTAEKGIRIDPYGLELSARIADRARIRLPHWADRIWAGNARSWEPPFRFDYVTVLCDCVPENRLHAMLSRVIEEFVQPRGRMVVSCYGPKNSSGQGERGAHYAMNLLRSLGFDPRGSAEVFYEDGTIWTSVAWLDRA